MNKFQQLIQTLQTELIILIDDDFTPVIDSQEILTYLCFLNPVDRELFMGRLTLLDNSLVAPLNHLFNEIEGVEIQEGEKAYIEAGLLSELMGQKGEDNLLQQVKVLMELIEDAERKDDIANLTMMYGLRPSAGTENYNGFFNGLKVFRPQKSIRLYKGLEGAEFTSFENEIRDVNQAKNNKFPLIIVDRYLANNQNGNQIIQNLRDGDNGIDKFFSVLYTSQAEESFENYFHIQLRKDDENALEKVSEALALSAFASFFNQIYTHKANALKSAKDLVILSGVENMTYLAGMAQAEGETVFNAFNRWFDLLSDKKVQDELLSGDPDVVDLNFMIGLTKLVNSDFITAITGGRVIDQQFHDEVEQLATYEIYDYEINRFCSPPKPGDIFEIGGQLCMLAGQECDLVVRSNGSIINRKEKLGELVKCSFGNYQQDLKVDSSVDHRVVINHFEHDGIKGVLEIDLNSKEHFDFRLLDLCCLNEDGISRYKSIEFPLSSSIRLLPEKWNKYIPVLLKELNDKIKIQEYIAQENINPSILSGDHSFNFVHEKNDGYIIFPVKRIARIKGEFKEYVMQRYWQYKTRMALNTVGLYQRDLIKIQTLQVGFMYDLKEIPGDHHAWIQLTGNRDKNRTKSKLDLILKKEDILSIVDGEFKQALIAVDSEEIIITNSSIKKNKIIFSKEWHDKNLSVKILFPLFNEYANHFFIGKEELTAFDLFGKDLIDSNPNIRGAVMVNGLDTHQLLPEGNPPFKLELEQFFAGEIQIPEENIRLRFNRDQGKLLKVGQINQEGDV